MKRLKKWVKVVLKLMVIMIMIITIKDMFTKQEVIVSEGTSYTCNGNFLFKICGGVDDASR